ncbi:MAG: formyl transferase [Verrucomicrobia bacterium]|nr:formyl transferase [Verrucomicrobiota bacterium]
MRVFIITQNEPIYAPLYIQKIIDRIDSPIIGISPLSPTGKKGWSGLIRQRLEMYGLRDFLRGSMVFASHKLKGMLGMTPKKSGRFYSLDQLAKHHSIPIVPCGSVNNKDYIETLKNMEVDILLSVGTNQIFRPRLLRVPRVVTLNVHSSLLPKYRGLDGLFWAMVHEEPTVGVTVHVMNEGIDDGGIVEQQPFDVSPEDTLHALYMKAVDVGSQLLVNAVKKYEAGDVEVRENRAEEGSSFSWPTAEAGKKFRKTGRRFF